jgi:hypothetical protein
MAVVKQLGIGYYEIELSNDLVDPEVAAVVSRAFGNLTSFPEISLNELPKRSAGKEALLMSPD